MVAACAARFGWNEAQQAAALDAALRTPVQGVKGKMMRGAEPLPAMEAAAARVA